MKKFSVIVLLVSLLVSLLSVPAMANQTDHLTGDFIDIEDHWAYDQMSSLIAMGILQGYTQTVWDADLGQNVEAQIAKPYQKITRAEFAVLLYQALNLKAETEKAPFVDQIPNWAADAVNALYEEGIVKGNPDGTFRPSNNISRAEIVSMLVQALNDKGSKRGKDFPDVPTWHWAYNSIQKASAMGIVNGTPDGLFKPSVGAQRAEVMVMLYQFLLKDSSQAPDDKDLLARTDLELKSMEEEINGSGPVDFSDIKSLATGEHELLIPDGEAALNDLKDNGTVTYKVTYPGTVIRKSDRLAEVVYETDVSLEVQGFSVERHLKEHYFLMKIGDEWYIYSQSDEDML